MATATLIMIAPCASRSTWKCLLSCQVLPFGGMRKKLPDYAGVRQMIQEASETGFLKDGHVIILLLIGYKQNKQINQKALAH